MGGGIGFVGVVGFVTLGWEVGVWFFLLVCMDFVLRCGKYMGYVAGIRSLMFWNGIVAANEPSSILRLGRSVFQCPLRLLPHTS